MGLKIELTFSDEIDAKNKDTFARAADRWSDIIKHDLPPVQLPHGAWVSGIRVDVQGINLPHTHGIRGKAGPTYLRPDSLLPAAGILQADPAALHRLEAQGILYPALLHQMAHVLGFGLLWSSAYLNLVADEGGYAPLFTGPKATQLYSELTGCAQPGVPVENTGGRGNRDFHWREHIFGNELMSGHMDAVSSPLSRLTLAALEDMGYTVDYAAAEAYALPHPQQAATRQLDLNSICRTCQHASYHPDITILSPESLPAAYEERAVLI
ncbi:leishmanolysin-related zinc metalloendopeptidase [Roseivirga sp. BDSF3-8]|uniref:leishmanolysin-related zinc metalloendopeptidase n=1 Tax=Roseivirga sp. BDSF3-8 TaxID=3241598 RepID=UPI003531BDAC